MRVGSLFSGIGGLDLALEMEGHEVVWQSEIDKLCCKVLAKRWPGVPNLGDIRAIAAPPPVDILCGGFPCQDVSTAGARGAGAELDPSTRSGLWWEFRRLIDILKPAGVLIENVGGLTSMGLSTVRESLGRLGYSVDVTRIAAEHVGAPHRRLRVFIVAVLGGVTADTLDRLGGRWSSHAPVLWAPVGLKGWPTPLRSDKTGRLNNKKRKSGSLDLSSAVDAYSPPVPPGTHYSPLNPNWVELLMGFPPGWTKPEADVDWWPTPQWPMGPGLDQHPWEPARLERAPGNRGRLAALGNAVVPWAAVIAARRLGDLLQGRSRKAQLSMWASGGTVLQSGKEV